MQQTQDRQRGRSPTPPANPAAMIMVERNKTPARPLDSLARGLAQNFGGAVEDKPTNLGDTSTSGSLPRTTAEASVRRRARPPCTTVSCIW